MIGNLINTFDNLPEKESNLGSFNKLFKSSLKGDLSDSIEILGLAHRDLRKVLHNGKLELIELCKNSSNSKHKKNSGTKKNINYKYRYQVFLKGKLLGEYRTYTDISKKYSINGATIKKYADNGRLTKRGYSFKQVLNPEY